jgi:hypothetical protein
MATKKAATPKSVTLVSTLDHPVTISYDGDAMIIPPRGRIGTIDPARLGAIPKGVRVK